MNLDGKDPKVEVEYDETDELVLEEIYLETLYELMLEEEKQELQRLLKGVRK